MSCKNFPDCGCAYSRQCIDDAADVRASLRMWVVVTLLGILTAVGLVVWLGLWAMSLPAAAGVSAAIIYLPQPQPPTVIRLRVAGVRLNIGKIQ